MYADNYYTLWHILHSPSSPKTDVCLQLLHFMTQSTQSIVSRDGCMPTTTTHYDTIYTVHLLPRQMYAYNYYTLWHNLHSPSSPETDVCLLLLYDTIYTVHRLPRHKYADNYYTLWHSPSSPETDVCLQLLHFMTQSTQSIVSRDRCMPTTTTLYDTIYTVHRLQRQMYADNYYTLWHNLHSPSSPETDVCLQLLHFMTQSTQSIVSRDECMPTTTTLYDTIYTVHRLPRQMYATTTTLYDTIYTVHRLPRQMYADNYYTWWHNLHSPSSPETDVFLQLLHFMTQSTQSIVSRDRCMPTTTTLYDTIYTVHRLPRQMYAYNYYTLWHNLHSPSSPETDVCRQLLHFNNLHSPSSPETDTTTTLYDTISIVSRHVCNLHSPLETDLPRDTVHRCMPTQLLHFMTQSTQSIVSFRHNLHSPSSPDVCRQLLHFMTQSTQSIVSRDRCMQLLHSMTQSTQSIDSRDRCMPTTTTLYDTIYIVSRDRCMPTTTTVYYTIYTVQLLHSYDTIYTVHRLPRQMYADNYYTTTTHYDTIYTVHLLPRQMYAYNYYTLWHNLHSPSSPETDVCRQLLHFMTQSTQSIVSRDISMPTTTTLYDTFYTVHPLPRQMYAYNYYTLWHNLHSPSSPETDVCLQLLHFIAQSTQSIVYRERCMPTTTTLYDTIYTVHRLPRHMYADNYYTLWHILHSPSSPKTDVCRQLLHCMTQSTQSIVSRDRCMPTTTTLYDTFYTVHRLPRQMYAYNYYTLWHNLHSPSSPETDVCRQLLHFMTQSTQSIVYRERCMPTTTTFYNTIYTVHRLPR